MKVIGILIVGVLCIMGVVFILLALLGLSKQKCYEQDMIFLESAVQNWIITHPNYVTLQKLFNDVAYNDCDPERTHRLYTEFKKKFECYTIVQNLQEVAN